MSQLVTIYGGSGFVGRYIARRMAKVGWRVRVAVRRPNEGIFVKPYGVVGQVEPVFCNIRDDDSVAAVLHGSNAVVNCVGTFAKSGKNNFDAIQHEGAERIARLAAAAGVQRLVHISSIGADPESDSDYLRTKALGEVAIQKHFPGAVILRPSVVFGPEDAFFNRFAALARMSPVLPLVGAETRFQPVYVDDIAAAAETAILGAQVSGTYELGGPKVASFRAFMSDMLAVIHRTRVIINMPFFFARTLAYLLDLGQVATAGMIRNNILTRDQVRALAFDSVVSDGARGFKELGIKPTSAAAVLPEYLWRFRPSGQYDAIKKSAKNLKI